ncbi:SPOR domain-containing protein [Glaciecola sp. 2405UD65-10]|uniref:SPOR domain-containing protein n=1 Tax=Glaciecola sp. 2405UD65-10 TaxID=3397244 RepID=UPI003B5923C3
MSDQQRTLNEFLAHQQENTDISFFSAKQEQNATDYRGMICRQLGGHTVGSFVRPLNQLLIDLPSDDGPFLVCITQAQHLSNDFLQELWDWVMHAKQYNRKLHLNIILFGKNDWAQASQEWLPSQNSHKPVLLSSQSLDAVGFDVNALEALMAQDKEWFSGSASPIVTKKWFISSVLAVFLCLFIGMITWQYPEDISRLLAGEKIDNIEAPAFDLPEEDVETAILPIDDTFDQVSTDVNEVVVVEPVPVTEDILVRSWQSEKQTEASQTVPIASTAEQQAINSPQEDAGDFQVPDIISVAQLDERLGSSVQDPIETPIENDTVANIEDDIEDELVNEPQLPSETVATTIDYRFDETTLLALPSDAIVLQLSGIQNPVVLENYLNNNNLKANTWVYETQRYGGPWYVVVYNQSFDSIDAALNRLSSLPDDIRDAQPFAKSINQIQQEIKQR